ncbi:hypothetical protein D041_4015A, partial [Vibrio parahaemolyticus EKP-008]
MAVLIINHFKVVNIET